MQGHAVYALQIGLSYLISLAAPLRGSGEQLFSLVSLVSF